MRIEARRGQYADVEPLRELYRREVNCQIIHDSFLQRGLADPYVLDVDGWLGGYGAVSNRFDKGRLMEFYVVPHLRAHALPMFRELLDASGATHIEAQTNIPLMLLMLYDCAVNIAAENHLFHDAFTSGLSSPGGVFRRVTQKDREAGIDADWMIEQDGRAVATGGFLCHYNPPFADVYVNVIEGARRQGFGSYFVQEVKRVCREAGKLPAARCNADNVASKKALQRAGMLPCGDCLLVGQVTDRAGAPE